jgi:hypothetical protein
LILNLTDLTQHSPSGRCRGRVTVLDAQANRAFELSPERVGTTVREGFRTINSPVMIIFLDRLAGRPRRLWSRMWTTLGRLSAAAERISDGERTPARQGGE